MDAVLHETRTHEHRTLVPAVAIDSLPTGTFVTRDDSSSQAFLVASGVLYPWSHGGYGPPYPL